MAHTHTSFVASSFFLQYYYIQTSISVVRTYVAVGHFFHIWSTTRHSLWLREWIAKRKKFVACVSLSVCINLYAAVCVFSVIHIKSIHTLKHKIWIENYRVILFIWLCPVLMIRLSQRRIGDGFAFVSFRNFIDVSHSFPFQMSAACERLFVRFFFLLTYTQHHQNMYFLKAAIANITRNAIIIFETNFNKEITHLKKVLTQQTFYSQCVRVCVLFHFSLKLVRLNGAVTVAKHMTIALTAICFEENGILLWFIQICWQFFFGGNICFVML